MRYKIWLAILATLLSFTVKAQEIDSDTDEESLPIDEKIDMSTLSGRSRSLDLNTISKAKLISLGTSVILAERIVYHRDQYGEFIDIHELQAIQGMNKSIFGILQNQLTISKTKAKIEFTPKTFIRLRMSPPEKGEEGDAQNTLERSKIYLSTKYEFNKNLKVAATFEKDQGEKLFYNSKELGPDYSSAYFSWVNVSHNVAQLILGDFSVRFGQGLLVNNQYRRSNSTQGHVSKLVGQKLKPYGSINENGGFRGFAVKVKTGTSWNLHSFLALNNRDATKYEENGIEYFTLSTSGIHTSELTIKKRDLIKEWNAGVTVGREWGLSTLNFNWIGTQFTRLIRKPQDLLFTGTPTYITSTGISLDHNIFYNNFNFYGETAILPSGTLSTMQALMFSPHSSIQGHIVVRHYPADFLLDHYQAFGHSSKPRNENGIYTSLNWKLNTKWSAYVALDHWNRPWLSYQNDGSIKGQVLQLTIRKKERKKYEYYSSFKLKKSSQYNLQENKTQDKTYNKTWSLRTHCSIILYKGIEFRTRIELNNIVGLSPFSNPAVLSFADFIYKPIATKLSFTARIAFFDIPNFDRRIYSYENNLTHVFSIPFYNGRGLKYYLNAKYRLSKLSIEGRVEYTNSQNPDDPNLGIQSKVKYSFQASLKL